MKVMKAIETKLAKFFLFLSRGPSLVLWSGPRGTEEDLEVYFGGKGKTSCFRDLHALDTSTYTWLLGEQTGVGPWNVRRNRLVT